MKKKTYKWVIVFTVIGLVLVSGCTLDQINAVLTEVRDVIPPHVRDACDTPSDLAKVIDQEVHLTFRQWSELDEVHPETGYNKVNLAYDVCHRGLLTWEALENYYVYPGGYHYITGNDRQGYKRNGHHHATNLHKDTGTEFNPSGIHYDTGTAYDREGYSQDGFHKDTGVDREGFNREGYHAQYHHNRAGFDKWLIRAHHNLPQLGLNNASSSQQPETIAHIARSTRFSDLVGCYVIRHNDLYAAMEVRSDGSIHMGVVNEDHRFTGGHGAYDYRLGIPYNRYVYYGDGVPASQHPIHYTAGTFYIILHNAEADSNFTVISYRNEIPKLTTCPSDVSISRQVLAPLPTSTETPTE